tara:strand:- start:211 stop:1137 length:927 start_codon:yes stop_codon:yes gene_type:complete
MALVLLDRAKVVATSMSGTGDNYTLTNAPPTGFVDFTGVGDGNTTYYVATDTAGNFEIGIGTFATSGEVLTRTDGNVIKSTNSNNKVSWPSNSTPTVFIAQPADKAVFKDANNSVTITSTDDGAGDAPDLVLYRNSSSPDDADDIGQIFFRSRNDNSQDVEYARIGAEHLDVSDGTEDGKLLFQVMSNGTISSRMDMRGGQRTRFFNQDVELSQNVDLIFEGSSSNSNETTLTLTDPTQDNTITLPDATGTVLTTGNSDTPTTTTSSGDADFVLVDDGGTMKKITPTNLGIGSGINTGKAIAMSMVFG